MAKIFIRAGSTKYQCEYWVYIDGQRERRFKSTGIRIDGKQSERTAEIVAAKIERDAALGGAGARRPSKTLEQAIRALLSSQELAQRTEHTTDYTMYRGKRLIEHFGPDMRMSDIDADKVMGHAAWSRQFRSAFTVGRELDILSQAFRAVHMEPPKFPELGDTSNKPQRVLELDEQRALLLATPPKRKTTILGYLQLGLRLSEPWKVTQVDVAGRYLFVDGTKTKGSKRWVPVPDELFDMLPRTVPVFPAWLMSNVDSLLKKIGRRTGIDAHLSVNDLRGTFATMQARAGTPLLTLSKIMGNSPKMLEQIYSQVQHRGEHHEAVRLAVPRLTATKPKGETGT